MNDQRTQNASHFFSKLLFWLSVVGVVASVRRILFVHNDWILGPGLLLCSAILVITTWANTTAKLEKQYGRAAGSPE